MQKIKQKEQLLLQQANTYISQNNPSNAKQMILQFSKKNKLSMQSKHLLCLSHALLGELKNAKTIVLSLIKKAPNNIEYLKLAGNISHEQHEYRQAEKYFKNVLALNNNDFLTMSNLASTLKEMNKTDEAEKYFEQSLKTNNNQPDTLTNYGLLKLACGNIKEAINLHKKSLGRNPQNETAIYNLAHALREDGSTEDSIKIYNELLRISPNNIKALCDLAQILIKLKKHQDALLLLKKAESISPGDETTNLYLGITYKHTKDYESAKEHLQKAYTINPKNGFASYHLATLSDDFSISKAPYDYIENLFDEYAEEFDHHLAKQLQYKMPELVGSMVNNYIDTSNKYNILDLGCGTGLTGIHLKDIADKMVGIDLSGKMLERAKLKNVYDELIKTGIDQYYETCVFKPDIVVSADVFIYIGDIDSIFCNTAQIITKNGLFVFTTEDDPDCESFKLRESSRFAHNESYIRKLAGKYDFKIIKNQQTVIRLENKKPVDGQVYLLEKN